MLETKGLKFTVPFSNTAISDPKLTVGLGFTVTILVVESGLQLFKVFSNNFRPARACLAVCGD